MVGILFLQVLSALGVNSFQSLRWYYEWHPEVDYKGLVQCMAQSMRPHDVIFYVDPDGLGVWRFRTTPREYYWKQYLNRSESFVSSVRERSGPLNRAVLESLAAEFPYSTIWFCAFKSHLRGAGRLLGGFCEPPRRFGGMLVWVLGEPTANLIADGGFEEEQAFEGADGEVVQVVLGAEAYAGEHALRLCLDTPDNRRVGFRVNTPGHSVQSDIRNAGFELWKDNRIIGWQTRPASPAPLSSSSDVFDGQASLAMQEFSERIVITQRLDTGLGPGNVIELSAWGKATQEHQLQLGLVYRRQEETLRKTSYHPGGNAWAQMVVREKLPEDMDWDSLAVEIARDAGGPGSVLVDGVQAELQDVRASLDPHKTYTLTLMARYENLRSMYETSNLQTAASVMLAYTAPDGKDQWVHLADVHGSRDWHQLTFPIVPGLDIPTEASWLLVSVALYGTGTMWIDNVCLEAKDHPTPFTEGTRPPHDETVARVFAGAR